MTEEEKFGRVFALEVWLGFGNVTETWLPVLQGTIMSKAQGHCEDTERVMVSRLAWESLCGVLL